VQFETETHQHRFAGGKLPSSIRAAAELAQEHGARMLTAFQEANSALKKTNLADKRPDLTKTIADLMYQSAYINGFLSSVVKALNLLCSHDRAVRWVFSGQDAGRDIDVVSVHISPLEGADVLRSLLWESERAVVAMVSATLQDFKGFERFKARLGVGDSLRTMALDPIFPYRENTLSIVDMRYSPRMSDRKEFLPELEANMLAQ